MTACRFLPDAVRIGVNNPVFGRVTTLRPGTQPRVIQLGAKFIF